MGRYEIRPLGPWLEPVTPERTRGRFRSPWSATIDLLERETEYLGAGVVVLQVDVADGEIRRDGMLYARARVDFPGVRVSFSSDYGPLTYATDAFDHWQTNVRAIALALGALRAVDRYGVTKRGEQYTGWKALPPSSPTEEEMTPERAAQLLAAFGAGTPHEVRTDPDARARAFRAAARKWHPDVEGGDAATFRLVTRARDVLAGFR
jgi:hypothetical protein